MYSRCHLIAGRFSRVRYRSATESTQSAGTRSCSDSSFSLSFSLFLSFSFSHPLCFSHSFCPSVLILSLSFSRSLTRSLVLPFTPPPSPPPRSLPLLFHRRSSSCWSPSSSWSSFTRLVAARRQHRQAGGYPVEDESREKKESEAQKSWPPTSVRRRSSTRDRVATTVSRLFFLLSRIFAGTSELPRERDGERDRDREGGDTFGQTRGTDLAHSADARAVDTEEPRYVADR